MKKLIFFLLTTFITLWVGAQTPATTIKLNAPVIKSGKLLMEALQERQSTRSFSSKELPLQELSNLLWAVNGFNRADKRVVPTSQNKQDIEVYAVLSKGIYWYDAKNTQLQLIVAGDHRQLAGGTAYGSAPVNLLLISDLSKLGGNNDNSRMTSNIDAGHCSQNGYLYCASAGLACVVRGGGIDRAGLSEQMRLKPEQYIVVAQTIGYKP